MLYGCKNCGGIFTQDEVLKRKPPAHPWTLTEKGQQVIAEKQATGENHPLCSTCGQNTLRPAVRKTSAS